MTNKEFEDSNELRLYLDNVTKSWDSKAMAYEGGYPDPYVVLGDKLVFARETYPGEQGKLEIVVVKKKEVLKAVKEYKAACEEFGDDCDFDW